MAAHKFPGFVWRVCQKSGRETRQTLEERPKKKKKTQARTGENDRESATATDLDNLQHLHPGDLAVPIQVVHVEGPVELLLEAAARRDGQGADELSEVDGAVAVLVKGAEGVLCEFGSVAVREELQREDDG